MREPDYYRGLETLHSGQYDNLVWEDLDMGVKVWVSRCGVEDGMPEDEQVSVENRDYATGRWETYLVSDGNDWVRP